MPDTKELFSRIKQGLPEGTPPGESQAIALLVLEDQLGFSRTEILSGKEISQATYDNICQLETELARGIPVQYVLGRTQFYGLEIAVDSSVLIPRPETEDLVTLALNMMRPDAVVFDAGTGSGCIALALAAHWPKAKIHAGDISVAALQKARENSVALSLPVHFHLYDILHDELPVHADLLISNPPYISPLEKLSETVVAHEPHLALFADGDALGFYRALARQTHHRLNNGGMIAVETHEARAEEVATIFEQTHLHEVHIHRDFTGRLRMVTAKKI